MGEILDKEEESYMKESSDETLNNVSGGLTGATPKIGTTYCIVVEGSKVSTCYRPDVDNIASEYIDEKNRLCRRRICLNCGAQWSNYYNFHRGKWVHEGESW
jgi:hypothetical protein